MSKVMRAKKIDSKELPASFAAAARGEGDVEVTEFLLACDRLKIRLRRPFITLSQALEVAKYLGYRKIAPVGEYVIWDGE